ncbi:MAG: 2-C-methyl-D-erythritol 4-phosphate cytidylyltransferase [Lachnospiraceae bacterium]|nr:2-C-methyl-D-erythritol 4-phosphate cytidylyltransferase [Lachnospiraceae bacterium]
MNYAIIVAGGVGSRMGHDIPKQFIEVEGKTVLAHTLENFEKHPMVHAIGVVCIDGWLDQVLDYADKYKLTKFKWVIKGGNTVQESIRNGVEKLKEELKSGELKDKLTANELNVIIHDGIRPLVDSDVLTDVINTCEKYGNGVSSLPYNEQIFVVADEISTTSYIPRETLRRVSTPQAYKLDKLVWAYDKAFKEEIGIYGSSYTNTMMVELGERLFFAKGSDKNIKLTTPDDLEIFKGYLNGRKQG